MTLKSTAQNAIVAAGTHYGGPTGGAVAKYLFDQVEGRVSSALSPAKVVKSTVLGRYLDRRYARKCGVEVKSADFAGAGSTITTTLTSMLGNIGANVTQGLSNNTQRVGNSIEIKNVDFRLDLTVAPTSTTPCKIRLIWVKLGVTAGTALGANQVLADTTNIRSAYAIDVTRDFKILRDYTISLSGGTSADKDGRRSIHWNYRPKGCHEVEWTQADTTGVIADIEKGTMQLLMMYEGAAGGAPSVSYYYRINYIDG